MTALSDRIISGRVIDVRVERDPGLGQDVTRVTLEVDRTAKGKADRILTFTQIGNQELAGRRNSPNTGLPRYHRGEELVLFLARATSTGLSAPLGLGQGKFVVYENIRGRRMAINEFGNRMLLDGLSSGASMRLGESVRNLRGRREIPADALLNMVESLARAPTSQ